MTKQTLKRDSRSDTRRVILEAGIKVVLQKGYHECGLTEILQEAGVPKGSFCLVTARQLGEIGAEQDPAALAEFA